MGTTENSLAVFDLDGTITSKDTYLEFIKFARGPLSYLTGLAFLSPFIIAYYLKLLPNDSLKEKFFAYFFKGRSIKSIKVSGDLFSEKEIPKLMRTGASRVLDWHKAQGHQILILSASADIWLKGWCAQNNFELICTKFETQDGIYTGRLDGKNCFGEEKRLLLQAYLKQRNFDYSYGYGDSSADKYFLELVDQPYLMTLDTSNVERLWKAASEA